MLKKEIMDTLKQTALVLSFLVIIPVIFGINQMRLHEEELNFMWYFDWSLSYLIPVLVIYLAYNLFASEDSDGASEYLLALPISKWKILFAKILPRFVVILLLVWGYEAIFQSSYCLTIVHYFLTYEGLFIILIPIASGFFLGISERKNPILVIAFSIPVLYLLMATDSNSGISSNILRLYWFKFMKPNGITAIWVWQIGRVLAFSITALIPSVLPILVLIPVFKSWDASSGKIRSERILKRMSVPLGLLIVLYSLSHFKLF